MNNHISIVMSWVDTDNRFLAALRTRLRPFQREGWEVWSRDDIRAGEVINQVYRGKLFSADMLVVLVSSDYLGSDYALDSELFPALQLRSNGQLKIIPIIVRPTELSNTPFFETQNLPPKGAISTSMDPDETWIMIMREIKKIADDIISKKPKFIDDALQQNFYLHNHPLVGREQSLVFLDAVLDDQSVRIVSLYGDAGVGKSALVIHWIRKCLAEQRKYRYLSSSFFQKNHNEDSAVNQNEQWTRGQHIAREVSSESTIFILDILEMLQTDKDGNIKDKNLLGFLSYIDHLSADRSSRCLCVLLSRSKIKIPFQLRTSYRQHCLTVLSRDAAREILKNSGINASQSALDEATKYLGYHPLSLVLAAEYVKLYKRGRLDFIRDIPLLSRVNENGLNQIYAESVMKAYESQLSNSLLTGSRLPLSVLYYISLFDRTIKWDWLQENFFSVSNNISQEEIDKAIDQLVSLRLIDVSKDRTKLTCHALIREYFSSVFSKQDQDSWRQAHMRLYEYFQKKAVKNPHTLEQMEPLFLSLRHGCKAGLYQDALDKVYKGLILRTDQTLGNYDSLLNCISNFFEPWEWGQPIQAGLTKESRYFILIQAAKYLSMTRGFADPEVHTALSAAKALCSGEQETFEIERKLWSYYIVNGDPRFKIAYKLSIDWVTEDKSLQLECLLIQGISLFYLSDIRKAHDVFQAAVKLYDEDSARHAMEITLSDQEPGVLGLSYHALVLLDLGLMQQSLERTNRAVALAESIHHPSSLSLALTICSMIHSARGEYKSSSSMAKRAVSVAQTHGYVFFESIARVYQGWAEVMLGSPSLGLSVMQEAFNVYQHTASKINQILFRQKLASACLKNNDLISGMQHVNAVKIILGSQVDRGDSEITRIEGELLLASDPTKNHEVEELFRKSRDFALGRQNLLYELRTVISWSELLALHDRIDDAYIMLNNVYGQFAELIDTGDLGHAKDLLMKWNSKTKR